MEDLALHVFMAKMQIIIRTIINCSILIIALTCLRTYDNTLNQLLEGIIKLRNYPKNYYNC
jgi:hypothetical protein